MTVYSAFELRILANLIHHYLTGLIQHPCLVMPAGLGSAGVRMGDEPLGGFLETGVSRCAEDWWMSPWGDSSQGDWGLSV